MSFCFAVVHGSLSSEPVIRVFDSGARLAVLQVTVREGEEPTVSVPVTVWDPPAFVEDLGPGDEVIAIGRIQRRFFGGGGGPRLSKVEVIARELVKGDDRRRVQAAYKRARAGLEGALQSA